MSTGTKTGSFSLVETISFFSLLGLALLFGFTVFQPAAFDYFLFKEGSTILILELSVAVTLWLLFKHVFKFELLEDGFLEKKFAKKVQQILVIIAIVFYFAFLLSQQKGSELFGISIVAVYFVFTMSQKLLEIFFSPQSAARGFVIIAAALSLSVIFSLLLGQVFFCPANDAIEYSAWMINWDSSCPRIVGLFGFFYFLILALLPRIFSIRVR